MLGEDRIEFRSANKWAKKVVAWAKACPLDGVYSKQETPEGKKKIRPYKIAKSWDKATGDLIHTALS